MGSMPLAIVGSAFANAVDKINDAKIHKEAARDSSMHGFGMMSYVNNHHALILMKVKEIQDEMHTFDRRMNQETGKLSARDSSFAYETVMDLREQLTGFSSVLHKELYLHGIKPLKEAKALMGDVQEDETAIAEVQKQSEPAKQMLMEFYRKFDTNKDGQVTYGELQD